MGITTRYHRTARYGFTLVELIVVIVVIAILTAVTVVAYNGVQDHAKQTLTLNAFDQYAQMLLTYKTTNGHYPPTQLVGYDNTTITSNYGNTSGTVCLSDTLPANAPFSANQCIVGTGANAVFNATSYSAINSALMTVSPKLPQSVGVTSSVYISAGGVTQNFTTRGVFYTSQLRPDGASQNTHIQMAVQANNQCGRGVLFASSGVTSNLCQLDLK